MCVVGAGEEGAPDWLSLLPFMPSVSTASPPASGGVRGHQRLEEAASPGGGKINHQGVACWGNHYSIRLH